ncbi:MAG: hypothetical protein ACLFVC_02250 [Opitutales bacterium]
MKHLLPFLSLLWVLPAGAESPSEIIDRARATVGEEKALDGLVTLQMTGGILPADPKMPEAGLLIVARKPASQRLEVKVDDLVETTILNGREACIVRTNLEAETSQMRPLTDAELDRVRYSTRQFFSFYQPDFKNGEKVAYEGIEQRRGIRCHKLVYSYPDGITTTRFFAVNDDRLVSMISHGGVESVERGSQSIGGIRFPEKVEYFEDGEKLHTVVLTNVFVNKPLPEGIFSVPEGRKRAPAED